MKKAIPHSHVCTVYVSVCLQKYGLKYFHVNVTSYIESFIAYLRFVSLCLSVFIFAIFVLCEQ